MRTWDKATPEILCKILDGIVKVTSLDKAAAAGGIHPATLFRWMQRSHQNPEDWEVEWNEDTLPFHEQAVVARKLSATLLEAELRSSVIVQKPLYFAGKAVWRRDPRITDEDCADPDVCDLLWGQRDGLLRDSNGHLVQATEPIVNNALAVTILRGLFPGVYGERKHIDVQHGGGVLVVGQKPPTQIEQARPIVEQAVTEAVYADDDEGEEDTAGVGDGDVSQHCETSEPAMAPPPTADLPVEIGAALDAVPASESAPRGAEQRNSGQPSPSLPDARTPFERDSPIAPKAAAIASARPDAMKTAIPARVSACMRLREPFGRPGPPG